VEECGPYPVFASFTLAFVLQLRKKHGKTSVRVSKTSVRSRKTSVRVQYTYCQNTHTLRMYVTQKYWEHMTVFPCQRFQYLLHCWHWRVNVSTTERRISCISMVAVLMRKHHILTLYVHIAIFVNNVKIYTCFSSICIQKTHDFSTSTWKLLGLRIFHRHISCLWQFTIF
jgi:hypothetical protein